MEYILTATEKKYEVKHCGAIADTLHIIFSSYSMIDVVNVFAHPEETVEIDHWFDENNYDRKYSGYTDLISVSYSDNDVMIVLRNNNILM